MKVYFFRHGETVEWARKILLGHLPGTLSEKGKTETRALAEQLIRSGIPFDTIVTSDLERAVETGKILSAKLDIPLCINPLIRERKAGDAEGKTEDEIDWVDYEKKAFPYRKHPGGESFYDVKKRAKTFLDTVSEEDGANVIVISHSVFIAMACAKALGMSMQSAIRITAERWAPVFNTQTRKMDFIRLDG